MLEVRGNEICKLRRKHDAGDPNDQTDEQSRHGVARAGDERRSNDFTPRPTLLASDKRDRYPVIRYDGMQYADRGDGSDEQ